ncbi:MAG: hypothetical protein N4A71_04595 [Carboxylicivirga sp.]|jgi:hypothetical protein|nr:hypothetical protein [Carboxylicivirga sp.]MCT4644848.1 hypothetical protein [Carboxylicivirga sp.]
MNCKCNKLYIGLLIGTVLPIIMSFVLYYFLYKGSLAYWPFLMEMVNIGSIGKLLSVSVLPNLVIFLIAINKERLLAARGIVTATIIYAVAIIALRLLL